MLNIKDIARSNSGNEVEADQTSKEPQRAKEVVGN